MRPEQQFLADPGADRKMAIGLKESLPWPVDEIMAGQTMPKGPYKLVTVNTAPERAKRLIGRLVEALKDSCTIVHAANVETIETVEPAVRSYKPDLLFCASMWTSEQAAEIQTIARKARLDIVTYALPQGMRVQQGPDAVVDHLKFIVPQMLKLHFGGGQMQAAGEIQ